MSGNFFASTYTESAISNISCRKQLNFSSLSLKDTVPGLLEVFNCLDVVPSILDRCGVMCLARMTLTCTTARDIISEYNHRTKRIFPVRCGGFDHEHHMFWTTYKRERAAERAPQPRDTLSSAFAANTKSIVANIRAQAATTETEAPKQLSSLPSQVDDTSYRPSPPSTTNGEDANNNWTSSLSPSSNDTNTYTLSPNSTIGDDTNLRLSSPTTLNGEPAQSAIPIYRFRSATLRARTIRLAKESTKSALPRYSPSRSCDIPLASNALNGRKHTYNLRNRHTKSNTG